MTIPAVTTRCDLHVHSSASLTSGEWYSKYFGCPESYADPVRQYELCKARGMTLVTLTDHDSIEGGLTLVDRPDFFLSEEITTRFPENGCVMHVLAWNITPAQHEEIREVREDIYALSRYLRKAGIAHALAHPMLSPNWRLDAETLEKSILLFPALEAVNGLVDRRLAPDIRHLLSSLSPGVMAALSLKHGLPLGPGGSAGPALVAGSDDHVHRRCGTIFTEVPGRHDAASFLRSAMGRNARSVGTMGDLDAMAACVMHTTYQHLRRRSDGGTRDLFVDAMDLLAGRDGHSPGSLPIVSALAASLRSAAAGLRVGPELDVVRTPTDPSAEEDARVVSAVTEMSDALLARAVDALGRAVVGLDVYGLLGALPDLGGALATAAPFLFAADHFGSQERQVRRVWREWRAFEPPRRAEHLAVFSDSLDKIDGVSTWCSRFRRGAGAAGRRVLFASCDRAPADGGSVSVEPLPAVARFEVPFYPGFAITVPSPGATIARLYREGVTHVEVATPGPMGLVGVAAARLLGLPVTASYHTDLPDLIHLLTGDAHLASHARGYLGWFYRSVDRVFVFSEVSREKLVGMGVPLGSIELLPAAVDPEDFAPQKSSKSIFAELGLEVGDRPIALSVGRVSHEKNLQLVVDAIERLQGRRPRPLLVVVGDGPARAELELRCRGMDFVAFLGFQDGDRLRSLYASARVFVYASRVDTLGLVNLEALASGLPVLVPAGSAIAEQLRDGDNAAFYELNAGALAHALHSLLDDPERAARLGEGGRRHTLARWQGDHFDRLWSAIVGAGPGRSAA